MSSFDILYDSYKDNTNIKNKNNTYIDSGADDGDNCYDGIDSRSPSL